MLVRIARKRGTLVCMDHGIDISHWQLPKDLDWTKLAQSQRFAIARATYGTRSDKHFRTHVASARKAGLIVGAYHFYRQTQPVGAQLSAFFGELEAVDYGKGDLLPVVDLEWNEKNDGKVRPDVFNTEARALVEKIEQEFGGCYVYIAPGFFELLGKPAWALRHPWWVSHYTKAAEPWCPFKDWDIWQYTGTGKVDGYADPQNNGIDCNHAKQLRLIEGSPDVSENDDAGEDDAVDVGDTAASALIQIADGLGSVSSGLRLLAQAAKESK